MTVIYFCKSFLTHKNFKGDFNMRNARVKKIIALTCIVLLFAALAVGCGDVEDWEEFDEFEEDEFEEEDDFQMDDGFDDGGAGDGFNGGGGFDDGGF